MAWVQLGDGVEERVLRCVLELAEEVGARKGWVCPAALRHVFCCACAMVRKFCAQGVWAFGLVSDSLDTTGDGGPLP